MKKLLPILIVCLMAYTGQGYGKTLIPCPGDLDILPDFPNAALSEYYDFGLEEWATGVTTELIRWKCLYAGVGWTTSLERWLLAAGVELTNLDEFDVDFTFGIADAIKEKLGYEMKMQFFATFSPNRTQDKYVTAGAGIEIAKIAHID